MNRRITIYSLFAFFLLQGAYVFAQQDALIRMYFIDPAFYNPSLESDADHAKAIMNYRKQWLGMENAPSHQYFSIEQIFCQLKTVFFQLKKECFFN